MQRWHSPWIVCITPPPPPPPPPPLPPPSPVFKSADNTHTLRRWVSTWPAPRQPEYRHSFLCAAECVLLGLCSGGWVDFRVLWIISTVTAAQRLAEAASVLQVLVQLRWLWVILLFLASQENKRQSVGLNTNGPWRFLFSQTALHFASAFSQMSLDSILFSFLEKFTLPLTSSCTFSIQGLFVMTPVINVFSLYLSFQSQPQLHKSLPMP